MDYDIENDALWTLVASGAAIAAGVLARSALKAGWKAVKHEQPPLNPASRETAWIDAVAWTAATGLAVGLARLVARRLAAEGWQEWRGRIPLKATSR